MYKSFKRAMGAVPETTQGLYEERVVINCTDEVIGVVDKYGNKHTVKPDTSESGGDVKIYIRSGLGNKDPLKRAPVLHDSTICVIDRIKLRTESIYVKEADLVICNYKDLQHVTHPNLSFSYEDNYKRIYSDLLDSKHTRIPTVKVIANDPTGKIDYVFISILDTICKVPVTHYATSDDGVTLIFPMDSFITKFIPFEEIYKNDGFVKTSSVNCFIGLSSSAIRCAMDEEFSNRKIYTQKDRDDWERSLKAAHKKEMSELESSLNAKFKSERNGYEATINTVKNNYEILKTEHESVKRVFSATNGYFETLERKMEHETKTLENESKKMKVFLEVIKVVAPVIGGLVIGRMTGAASAAAAAAAAAAK